MKEIVPEADIERMFKGHVAIYERHGPIEYVRWGRPDSNNCAIHYYRHVNFLMIRGDLGEAILAWSEPVCLEWIAGCNFGYYIGKLQASPCGRDGKEWSQEVAKEWLDRWFADPDQNDGVRLESLDISPYSYIENEHEWYRFLSEHSEPMFGGYFDGVGGIGMIYNDRLYLHFRGLQMAMARVSGKVVV